MVSTSTSNTTNQHRQRGAFAAAVAQGTLKNVAERAARMAGNRVLPITENVLIRADAEREVLVFTSTNLEQALTVDLPAKIGQEGTVLVPARLLANFAAQLPEDRVRLELDGTSLILTCGRIRLNLRTADPEDFPPIPQAEPGAQGFTVQADQLREALGRVVTSAAKEDPAFPAFAGVLLRVDGSQLRVCALDGMRVASELIGIRAQPVAPDTSTSDAPAPAAPPDADVPTSAVPNLRSLLNETGTDPDVTITIDSRFARFTGRGWVYLASLINAKFPRFEQFLLSVDRSTRMTVQVAELRRALGTVRLLAGGGKEAEEQRVRIILRPTEQEGIGELVLSTSSQDRGDAVAALDARVEGEGFRRMALKSVYLHDALQGVASTGAGEVELYAGDEHRALTAQPKGNEQMIFAMAPVRLPDGAWGDAKVGEAEPEADSNAAA